MYDITRFSTLNNMKDWLSIFEYFVSENQVKIPIIMIGGKADLQDKRSIEPEDAENLSITHNLQGFFECSSRNGNNVEELFEYIARKMLENSG